MDLNTILIIVGAIALTALVVHGIWSNRREKSRYFQNANTFSEGARQTVLRQPPSTTQTSSAVLQPTPTEMDVNPTTIECPEQHTLNFETQITPSECLVANEEQNVAQQVEQQINNIKITLPNDPQINSASEFHQEATQLNYQTPFQSAVQNEKILQNQPHFVAEPQIAPSESLFASPSIQENGLFDSPSSLQATSTVTPLVEMGNDMPVNACLGAEVDPFAPNAAHIQPAPADEIKQTTSNSEETVRQDLTQPEEASQPSPISDTQLVVLYVVAPENREFAGVRLAKSLEGLGFLFGERHIYHRHLDLTSTSPVLFSLANIQQPGTFDPYDMEHFSTIGVVLFMQLPSVGSDRANLKTMIRVARDIADDLGGYVLTEQQEIFDDHAEQDYLDRLN